MYGATNTTVPFLKGLNHLQLVYYEHSGDDYGYFGATLYTNSNVLAMYAIRKS